AGLALGLAPQKGLGADAKKKYTDVKFDTVDQVELRGRFYPSPKGTDAPVVLMLHELGGNISKKNWFELAEALQAKDFAVFLFDFRGHGRSLDIKEDFWRNPFNRTGVKGWDVRKPRETIGFKDFHKEYNLNLVNDIAAAKAYLDSLNDQGKVNSANVVLIGA